MIRYDKIRQVSLKFKKITLRMGRVSVIVITGCVSSWGLGRVTSSAGVVVELLVAQAFLLFVAHDRLLHQACVGLVRDIEAQARVGNGIVTVDDSLQ
jgi:hypothetical protein